MAMYVLDSTTKTIKVAMSAAAATTNPDYTVAYADNNGTVFTEGATDGVLNGTTDVTVCSAPAASTRRIVKAMTINNRDTAAVTLYIKYDNNGTQRRLTAVTLGVNETWTMDGTYDAYGNLKSGYIIPTPLAISGISGQIAQGYATTLTINGTSFGTSAITVRFNFSGTIADVSVTPIGIGTSCTVAVPSTIYNLTALTSGSITLIDSAGRVSNTFTGLSVGSLPTGGSFVATNGTYRIHIFKASATFTTGTYVPTGNYDYILVAGGGGAGGCMAGGGGAGGCITATNSALVAATGYSVTIGAGGAGTSSRTGPTVGGSNSAFNLSTAIGGGIGAGWAINGGAGGSGGGATQAYVAGAGTSGQGYAGGGNTGGAGGGGGGAGGAGIALTAGNGGIGIISTLITATQATSYAVGQVSASNVYFAGGGGGGYASSASWGAFNGGAGGLGGGGAGGNGGTAQLNGIDGTVNSGGGAGGGAYTGTDYSGGTGGSGVFIIRYSVA